MIPRYLEPESAGGVPLIVGRPWLPDVRCKSLPSASPSMTPWRCPRLRVRGDLPACSMGLDRAGPTARRDHPGGWRCNGRGQDPSRDLSEHGRRHRRWLLGAAGRHGGAIELGLVACFPDASHDRSVKKRALARKRWRQYVVGCESRILCRSRGKPPGRTSAA